MEVSLPIEKVFKLKFTMGTNSSGNSYISFGASAFASGSVGKMSWKTIAKGAMRSTMQTIMGIANAISFVNTPGAAGGGCGFSFTQQASLTLKGKVGLPGLASIGGSYSANVGGTISSLPNGGINGNQIASAGWSGLNTVNMLPKSVATGEASVGWTSSIAW